MTVAVPEHLPVEAWQEPDPAMPDRAREAHSLHLAGESWASIATRVGYASAKVCAMAVRVYLERAAVEQGPDQRRQQLDLERARFDALQAPYWQAALARSAPPAPMPHPPPAPAGDLMSQLTKLGEMKLSGLLTDEEFAAAKAQLLGSPS